MPFSRNPAEEASLYVMHFQAGGGTRGERAERGIRRGCSAKETPFGAFTV